VAVPVAAKPQPGKSNRIIQKLQSLLAACPLACQLRLFPRCHAVDPEPDQRDKQSNQK
jgi:hypothetical protein